MISVLDPYVSWIRDFLLSPKTQRFVVKAFFALLVVGSLILFATIAYAAFYWVYVPEIAHRAPVYLQYQEDTSTWKGTPAREQLAAVVDITGSNVPFLTAGQEYDVSIDLVMPTSERNIQHGNFMVSIRLLDKNGVAVANSSRPGILPYESFLVRTMKTIWRAVPLMFGFYKEYQELSVSLLEGFVESAVREALTARLWSRNLIAVFIDEILRLCHQESRVTRALVSISSQRLDIYSIQLRFDAHFRGLRYLMYYHTIPTALVFISSFLFWETLFALLGWKVFVGWWQAKTISPRLAAVRTANFHED